MSEPEQKASRAKPGAVLIGFVVLLVGEILILSNAGVKLIPTDIQPKPISTYAGDVDFLFNLILWIVGFFFVLTQGLLVYFCVKYRDRGDGRKAVHTHGSHTLELAWTFIPGLILFALAVFQTGTWGMMKFRNNEAWPEASDPSTVVIRVFAKQFEWHFWQAGPDNKFGTDDDIVERSRLVVPEGRRILVKLQTMDVLHSFWLPNVRLKQDILPGQTITQWFEILPGHTGKYEVVCAELCGFGHTTMRAEFNVETNADYNAYLKKRRQSDGKFFKEDHPYLQYWRETSE